MARVFITGSIRSGSTRQDLPGSASERKLTPDYALASASDFQ